MDRTGGRSAAGPAARFVMSANPNAVDIAMIGKLLQRLTADMANMRDDLTVMAAILRRLDQTMDRLEERQTHVIDDGPAMHAQHNLVDYRLCALEDKAPS
jgi:hypothetical protein